jgi:glutamate/tyrosine decarboxylase-like PLP-dependent enzyme
MTHRRSDDGTPGRDDGVPGPNDPGDLFEQQPDVILNRLRELRALDAPTHGGHVLAYVYDAGVAALDELAAQAQRMAMPVNGLDPTAFPSVAVMERDLVRRARDLLSDGDDVVGTVTSGGTESCLLAVKTARDAWRAAGGAGRARLVLPTTAHPAFHKAAHYLDVEPVVVPVDPVTFTPDPAGVASALDDRTCLVVVSAPSYAHGVVDPVEAVAAAAADRGVACHVDACIGGWVLPFTQAPPFDLGVPGVSSLSVDLHKYGYAPKGVSLLLHRTRDYARHQPFAHTSWPGYAVVNTTVLGSKPAAPLAAAWAIGESLGVSGYRRLARTALEATSRLVEALSDVAGLVIAGTPASTLVAVATDVRLPTSEQVDPHLLADAARRRGWVLQPQPALTQSDGSVLPRTAHLTVTPVTLGVVDELVAAADQLDASAVDTATAAALLEVAGLQGGAPLPADMAPVLALIERLPAPVAERLLVEYVARLSEP